MNADQDNVFERRFQNQLADLSRATDEALAFLERKGVGSKAVYLAHLAIEELATNILKYGYDDTDLHEILLQLRIAPGTILVVLEDDGHEFNPLHAPQPDLHLPAEEREPGGLGIHLVRNLAAKLDYERSAGRNRVTVRIPV